MAFGWYFVNRKYNNAGSEQSFGTMFGEESTFSQHFSFQLFFSFIRSIHSTLTYKTPVYLKYVETHLFFWKGWTTGRKFSEKSFQPTHMAWSKNLVASLTKANVCLKNVNFKNHLKLLMVWNWKVHLILRVAVKIPTVLKVSLKILFLYGDDFCVVRRIKVYIRGTGRYTCLKSKDSFLIVSKQ